jgi:hypothetical protein
MYNSVFGAIQTTGIPYNERSGSVPCTTVFSIPTYSGLRSTCCSTILLYINYRRGSMYEFRYGRGTFFTTISVCKKTTQYYFEILEQYKLRSTSTPVVLPVPYILRILYRYRYICTGTYTVQLHLPVYNSYQYTINSTVVYCIPVYRYSSTLYRYNIRTIQTGTGTVHTGTGTGISFSKVIPTGTSVQQSFRYKVQVPCFCI